MCTFCRHTLAWYDLLPVMSFLLLCGRCRYCKKKISIRYPLIELVTMGLFLFALSLYPQDLSLALATAFLFFGLLLMVIYDAQYQLIPDIFTLIVFLSAVVILFLEHMFLSGAIGAGLALTWFGSQWILSRGQYVGSGDILLGASLGLWLGWKGTITMLFLSYIIGAVYAIYLLLTNQATRKSRIAFGPLLAIGALLASFEIGDAYFRLFGL